MINSLRRVLLWTLTAIGGLLAAGALAVVAFVTVGKPIELRVAKDQIAPVAAKALQRSVVIEGPLVLLPAFPPAVQFEGLRIGNPAGWPEADFLRLKQARAELYLLSLLRGEIQIGEIDVEGLHVDLRTNEDGERNWPARAPKAADAEDPDPGGPSDRAPPALRFVELAALNLRDIVFRHRDAATGEDFTLELVEITGSALDHEPMTLQVHGSIQQFPYRIKATAGSLADLFGDDAAWPLDLGVESLGSSLQLAGEIAEPLRGRGLAVDFALVGRSLADVGKLLGTELQPIQPLTLTGRIEDEAGKYRATGVRGEIGTTVIDAALAVDLSRDAPHLSGNLQIQSIDVGPLLTAVESEAPPPTGSGEATVEPKPAFTGGFVASEDELDIHPDAAILTLERLRAFDAQFGITIGEILNGPANMRDISMAVDLEDGALSSKTSITLAEVPFDGVAELGPVDGKPRLRTSLSAENSDIGELAAMLTNAETIAGSFEHARLDFTAAGESLRELVTSSAVTLELANAALSYGDDSDANKVAFSLAQANLNFPASDESSVKLHGALLGETFDVSMRGGTFVQNLVEERWPIALEASGGGATLTLSGTMRKATELEGSDMMFSLTGKSVGGLATWLGINPDATQAYALEGHATHSLAGLRLQVDRAEIGNSAFTGQAGIRRDGNDRVTFAQLDFSSLDLAGFGALVDDSSQPDSEARPEKEAEVGLEALTIDVPILPNGIEIFDSDIKLRMSRIRLEKTDITRFSFDSKIRDGHVDNAPISAVLGGARFDGSLGIDLRDDVPKVRLVLGSKGVDIGILLRQLGIVDDLAMQAGRFALDIALEGATTAEMLKRSTLSAEINDAIWAYSAPGAEDTLDIRLPRMHVSAEPARPITLAIDALLAKTPASIRVTTDTLGSFARAKQALQLGIDIDVAKAQVKLQGRAPLPIAEDNLHFALDVKGERFSDFDELLDVSLPPVGPYRFSGDFGSNRTGYYVDKLNVSVGDSTLTGRSTLNTASTPPRLAIDLVAKRIQLDDFDVGDWSPAAQTQMGGRNPSKRSPSNETADADNDDRPGRALLSQKVLNAIDARATVRVGEVLSGKDLLGRGNVTTRLGNGELEVRPLELEVPGGSVALGFSMQPTETAVSMQANANIDRLDYGILARGIDPESKTGGLISIDVDLATSGPDLDHLMHGATGHIDFGLWPDDLNADVFELWAVSVLRALMTKVDKSKQSRVNCVIASFSLDDGLMQERVLFADTTNMQVEGTAEINFKDQTLRVRAGPRAKRPEFFSLAVPVGVSGKFEDFGLKINPIELTGQALAFVTSPVHVPIRRIFKRGTPLDSETACTTAWEQRNVE